MNRNKFSSKNVINKMKDFDYLNFEKDDSFISTREELNFE